MPTISIPAGYQGRSLQSGSVVWANARAGSSVSCFPHYCEPGDERLFVKTTSNASFYIVRGFLAFDTSPVAGKTIIGGKLKLYVVDIDSIVGPSIHVTRGVQPDPLGPDFQVQTFNTPWAAQNAYDTIGGSILFSDLLLNQYNEIDLNADALTWIEQAGGIKSQYESMDYKLSTYADFYAAQHYDMAQTFKVKTSHTKKEVKIRLIKRHAGVPGNIAVTIRTTDGGGGPTATILASGTILGTEITAVGWGGWITCDLGAGCALTAGEVYAICCVGGNGAANHAGWPGVTGCSYTDGHWWYSTDGGATWLSGPANYDLAFNEYGDDIAGGTLLCLRTTYDVNNAPPPAAVLSAVFRARRYGDDYAPLLELEYSGGRSQAHIFS